MNKFFGAVLNLPPVKKQLLKKQIKSRLIDVLISGALKSSDAWMARI